jgi:hypothetical protein
VKRLSRKVLRMTNQAKPPDSRRWHKTRKPNPKMQGGSMRECSTTCLRDPIEIARGLAMNPKKLGKVDKYEGHLGS